MSSLQMITAFYESDSDEEDHNQHQTASNSQNLSRLPLPKDALATIKDPFHVLDDSEQHEGRIRSFKHEQGNWATFVCIPYSEMQFDEFCFQISNMFSSCESITKTGQL